MKKVSFAFRYDLIVAHLEENITFLLHEVKRALELVVDAIDLSVLLIGLVDERNDAAEVFEETRDGRHDFQGVMAMLSNHLVVVDD